MLGRDEHGTLVYTPWWPLGRAGMCVAPAHESRAKSLQKGEIGFVLYASGIFAQQIISPRVLDRVSRHDVLASSVFLVLYLAGAVIYYRLRTHGWQRAEAARVEQAALRPEIFSAIDRMKGAIGPWFAGVALWLVTMNLWPQSW